MKYLLLSIALLFGGCMYAQLGYTKSQLVNLKGQYTNEGTEDGVKYITYNNIDGFLSESFFFLSSTGQAYFEVFKGDISIMNDQIKSNNSYLVKVGDMEWLSPQNNIHIKIRTDTENGKRIMVMVHYYPNSVAPVR